MPEGLQQVSMRDAFAAAVAEGGQASPPVPDIGVPPVEEEANPAGEQALPAPPEQPAAEEDGFSDEARELAKSLSDTDSEGQNSSESGLTPGSDDFWNFPVAVNTVAGPENVTIKELSDGYLRQADYTQKTQALAAERKHVEKATEFLEAFQSNPAEFVRSLAVQANLIAAGDNPIMDHPAVKILSSDEQEARIAELVEERLTSDPRVRELDLASAKQDIDAEFSRLQTKYQVPLDESVRSSLIKEAVETGSADLDGILAKRLVLAQQKRGRAAATKAAATARPGSAPSGALSGEDRSSDEKLSMREAWAASKVAAATQ